MSRPGTVRVTTDEVISKSHHRAPEPVKRMLDPAIARQLLACGDEISPAEPQSLRPLHVTSKTMLADGNEEGLTDSDNGILSDPDETLAQEERLEKRVVVLRKKRGLSSDTTLKQVFKLLDCLIGQYKLNRTDKLLQEIEAVCLERGGDWKVKWIQSKAFCRWKQYAFKEALELFLEQQEIVGPSAALCENIGHTLSSLGDLTKADEYFERAIELMGHGSFGNKGGIYMGLGLVRDRLGKTKEALPILTQALEHYQREHTGPDAVTADSSIIAKAHMSVGRAHEKLAQLGEAAKHMAEAVRIFRRTVGGESPLTAHAMGSLGKVKASQGGGAAAALKGASALCDDTAPSARLVAPRAQDAPTHARAPPGQLGGSPWPQEPASGRPKVEDSPRVPSRRQPQGGAAAAQAGACSRWKGQSDPA